MKRTILIPVIIILCAVSAAQTANVEVVPAPRVAVTQVTGSAANLLNNRGRDGGNLTIGQNITFSLPNPLTRILFQWMSSANGNYTESAYAPNQYVIEYSTDSTNGINGSWQVAVNETSNNVAARAHVIQSGSPIRYERFRITGGTGAYVDEIDIHDLTKGQPGDPFDTWGFIGDSITAWDAYWRDNGAGLPFNEAVNLSDGERYPSMINFGVSGNTAGNIYNRLQRTIDLNPGIHFWAIGVGTNDTTGSDETYKQNLTRIVEMLISNGKQPIIARIPFSKVGGTGLASNIRIQDLNEIVEEVRALFDLPAGPDLYAYFQNNPSHLRGDDGIHPNAAGCEGMNRLWADVALTIPKRKSTAIVGTQSGVVKAGEDGAVTFPVTAAGVSDGTWPAVLNGAPAGVTGSVTITGGSGTLTVNTTAATPQGTHPLTLTIGSLTSNSFNLAIAESFLGDVRYYPNPIQPSKGLNYAKMNFTNMPAGTRIKIYTMLGQVVRELKADASGMAAWDGKNNTGEKAASGVYIVYMEDGNGNKKRIKIAVER